MSRYQATFDRIQESAEQVLDNVPGYRSGRRDQLSLIIAELEDQCPYFDEKGSGWLEGIRAAAEAIRAKFFYYNTEELPTDPRASTLPPDAP